MKLVETFPIFEHKSYWFIGDIELNRDSGVSLFLDEKHIIDGFKCESIKSQNSLILKGIKIEIGDFYSYMSDTSKEDFMKLEIIKSKPDIIIHYIEFIYLLIIPSKYIKWK